MRRSVSVTPNKLKASYFEWAEPGAARRQLQMHIDHYELWAERWQQLVDALNAREVPLLQRRLEQTPPEQHEAIIRYKVFAYEGMIRRARTEIAWARAGLKLVDELENR